MVIPPLVDASWLAAHRDSVVVADVRWFDHAATTVGSALTPGERFEFIFDFRISGGIAERCSPDKLDPGKEFGELPREPVILWGWGWLPDQYGRAAGEDPRS